MKTEALDLTVSAQAGQRRGLLGAVVLAVVAGLSLPSAASIRSWTGGGGANTSWSNPANWDTGVPQNSDSLLFPGNLATACNNDLVGRTFDQIVFAGIGSGWVLSGNPITLATGINDNHSDGGETSVLLSVTNTSAGLSVNVENAGCTLTLSGVVRGPGDLTKTGAGTLKLAGMSSYNNSYAGVTSVNEGALVLEGYGPFSIPQESRIVVPGELVVGDGSGSDTVQLNYHGQIGLSAPVTLASSGIFDLNGYNQSIGSLTMQGGTITTGTGTLFLGGDVTTAATSAVIYGNLNLGSTGRTFTVAHVMSDVDLWLNANVNGGPASPALALRKLGGGVAWLQGSNTFGGEVVVDEGWVAAASDTALGGTTGGTTVNSNALLVLYGANIGAEHLVLNSVNPGGALACWGSPAALAGNIELQQPVVVRADQSLTLSGLISGPGGFTKIGSGQLILSGFTTNTYLGTTRVNEGALILSKSVTNSAVPGELIVGDGVGGTDADVVRIESHSQINNSAAVTVNSSGLIDLSGYDGEDIGSLAGSGRVELGNAGLGTGLNNQSTVFSGIITGSGGVLAKRGTGVLTLTGANTYSGVTWVYTGTLLVNGSQPSSPVRVLGQLLYAARLGGVGTVGAIGVEDGSLSPGSEFVPGLLTCGNLSFNPDVWSEKGGLTVNLTGPLPGIGYDQIVVRGAVSLGEGFLAVLPAFTTPAHLGDQFVIIDNDGTDPVYGWFERLNNGARFFENGYRFRINYDGGTGNDVVLTLTELPSAPTEVAVTAGNGNHVIDTEECNNLAITITNQSGTPMTGISAVLSTTTVGVQITQPYSSYPDLPPNGKGANATPFQISTWTGSDYWIGFRCGTDIDLQLTIDSATHGTFTTPLVLPSGKPATWPNPYPVSGTVTIPDVGTVESTNTVTDFDGPLTKVAVSLFLTHTYDADLTISLVAPDGRSVLLTSGNGGSGSDYGTNCSSETSRTTFDDAAATPITSGVAPFVGVYRPQGRLGDFLGTSGNGHWRLQITDCCGGSLGALRCWTLFLYGTICAAGGGRCDTCLPPVYGSITNGSPTQTGRVYRNHVKASCGEPKAWPGIVEDPFQYGVHAFTNTSGAEACVTVSLDSQYDAQAVAYLGSFDPANISRNYLGDAGHSLNLGNPSSFSIMVPAGARFCVTVNEMYPYSGGVPSYALYLSGLPCPTPSLAITPAQPPGNVRVHWPTWAGGYQLESSPGVSPPMWSPVPTEPLVNGSRYNVTNTAASPSRFYHLKK